MGKYLRWQAAIAVLGIVLLVALLRYTAYNYTTVTGPDWGGTLVEGVAGNPRYINPLFSQYNQVDGVLCALLFNGLTRLDEQGNVAPDLAESFTISPDGLTYDFRLRAGVYWHDGAAVTAADALYTIQALQDPAFPGSTTLSELWRTVEASAPEGPDGLAVRYVLKQPLAAFLDFTTIGLLPAHLWSKVPPAEMLDSQLNTRPIGTGPFQVQQITTTRADLIANPRFGGSKPWLAGISFRFYPDHQSLLPAYERGEIDAISWVWPQDLATVAQYPDLQLFSAPMAGYTLIYLNLQNPNLPFFQETAVRQALLYALDRQTLVDTVLGGQGLVAHSPFLPGSWAYDAQVKQYAFDLARARQLLDEAGWTDHDGDGIRDRDGVAMAFVLLGNEEATIQAVAAAWAPLGIQVAPQTVTLPGLAGDFLAPRAFDAALVHWDLSGDPDPYGLWHSTQSKTGQNYAGWEDRDADLAIEQARTLTDRALRRGHYLEFQQLFAEEVPALLLYYDIYSYGVRNKVHNVQIGPLNEPGDRFASSAKWYIVTQRTAVLKQLLQLDSASQ